MRQIGAAALLAASAIVGTAHAQTSQCTVPDRLPRPKPEEPTESEPRRDLPIGSYTLAVSWSPQYCAGKKSAADAFQCGGRSGRFGFVLHGLWPDGYGKAWPQYCKPTTLLPERVIRQNLCMTPSAQLLQHEWAKHGTCMSSRPADYFAKARALYTPLRFPDMQAAARRPRLTVAAFAQLFANANPGIRADMMRVTTTRGGWLNEVWLCLDKRLRYTRCPAHQGGAKPAAVLRIRDAA